MFLTCDEIVHYRRRRVSRQAVRVRHGQGRGRRVHGGHADGEG